MSTSALAALGAAVMVAGLLCAMVMIVVRRRRAARRRLTVGLVAVGERMDALADELAQTVETVREDALRARLVGSLSQALDIDEVIARCAEAAVSLPNVAGALVEIEVDGRQLVATAGLDADLAGAVSGPPDGSHVRAVGISYHYPAVGAAATAFRSGIAVPLAHGGRHYGYVTVFARGDAAPVAGEGFEALESIARQVSTAIDNARRLMTSGELPNADRLTGLGNRQLFHEALALEVARSRRQGRSVAVCVLDLDDFKRANDEVGQFRGDALLAETASLLRTAIRPTDIACRIGGDEFGVILPDASRIDAEGLFALVQATLRRRLPSAGPALSVSAGIAELHPGDADGLSLFARAEAALHRAKDAGRGTAA